MGLHYVKMAVSLCFILMLKTMKDQTKPLKSHDITIDPLDSLDTLSLSIKFYLLTRVSMDIKVLSYFSSKLTTNF